jgi:hypothetical protein
MAFLAWHILAILTVMTGSFLIGYSFGKKDQKVNYKLIDKVKNILRR